MKTLYFLMISAALFSCRGKIPNFKNVPKSNNMNNNLAVPRALYYLDKSVGSDDDKNAVKMNNTLNITNGSSINPFKTNYTPSMDLPKINEEMPKVKVPKLKKPNFKLEDYNSKEY